MSKLGPYRKGKKAFYLNRQNKYATRYLLLLAKKRERAIFAFKLTKIAVTSMMTASQIAIIKSKPIPRFQPGGIAFNNAVIDECVQDKAFAIAETIINSSKQVQSILAS